MRYDTTLLQQCIPAATHKTGPDYSFIKGLRDSVEMRRLFLWNGGDELPKDKYLTFEGENLVIFDFAGEVSAFAQPLTKPLVDRYTKDDNLKCKCILAQSYGEYFLYCAMGIPAIYSTFRTLEPLSLIPNMELLVMEDHSKDMFIDTSDLDLERLTHRVSRMQMGCNNFIDLLHLFPNRLELIDALTKIFSNRNSDLMQPKKAMEGDVEDDFLVKKCANGYGYIVLPPGEEEFRIINFNMKPEAITYNKDGVNIWHVKISFGNSIETKHTFNPADVFSTLDKFQTFVLSVGGNFKLSVKKNKVGAIHSLYRFVKDQFPKSARTIKHLGFSLERQELIYPGMDNPRYETMEFIYPQFNKLYPTLFRVKPANIWDDKDMKDHLHRIFLSTGYSYKGWSDEPCYSPVGPAMFIWAFATFYSPFVYRDYPAFPGINIYGDPSSGKSYLFKMLSEGYGCPNVVMSASGDATPPGVVRTLAKFNSGFLILDELTKENAPKFYKQLIGFYRNANNRQSKVMADMNNPDDTIIQTFNCPLGMGGEVEAQDKAARSRSLGFSMPLRTMFSPDIQIIEPIADGDVTAIRSYLAYLLGSISELNWQVIRMSIEKIKVELKNRYHRLNNRTLENWAILFAFAPFFLETAEEVKFFKELCRPNIGERIEESEFGHFAAVVDLGLHHILGNFRDRDNLYLENCEYSPFKNTFSFSATTILTCAIAFEHANPSGDLVIKTPQHMKSACWNCPYVIKPKLVQKDKDWNKVEIRGKCTRGYKIDLDLAPSEIKQVVKELETVIFHKDINNGITNVKFDESSIEQHEMEEVFS